MSPLKKIHSKMSGFFFFDKVSVIPSQTYNKNKAIKIS
ncbi:hypothetical protein C8C82_3135 [Flavobacterium sp. 81]|nr:hypothetical protein C8C82_3135 [Flavobacterium sp. 81]